VVLLLGFQKGRLLKEKGREQFWKKRSYKEKFEKWTEFHYF
jgi:hypothetical protein